MNILIKKLSDKAIMPTKNLGDAGWDLYSVEDYTLAPMERRLFKTDIAMSIPFGYFGRVVDRSGNALNKGLHVMAGVVDSIYRGEVGVVLINLNRQYNDSAPWVWIDNNVEIKAGDRIAQIIIEQYDESNFIEVDELDGSIRGTKGFGSSGS
jgi:dUTP pyrophosphatase